MTPFPPRRRQHPLLLEGVWLMTGSPEGARPVPGMSVVADPKGFTLCGPDPGTERTIPWEQTTVFTCQRPARLPDGSPATVLEVGLSNGRVLELLLPVTRVPPSETVVVETELAVMAEQYRAEKPASEQPRTTSAMPDVQPVPNRRPAPSSDPQPARANGSEARSPRPEQVPALVLQGSHSNGKSSGSSSALAEGSGALAAPTVSGPVSLLSESPAVAETAQAVLQEAKDGVRTARGAGAATYPPAAPTEPGSRQADSAETSPSADSEDGDHAGAVGRENRMFTLLVALIGVVVVVLIAELVLILFVLNHNPSTKSQSIRSQTSSFVYYPSTSSLRRSA